MIKIYFTFLISLITCLYGYAQKSNSKKFNLNFTIGQFIVGKGNTTSFWTGIAGEKNILKTQHPFLNQLTISVEIYFENGADKATVRNPTADQFLHEMFYHESNTGVSAQFGYYPFTGFVRGFHIAAGPLFVYSIRSYENRWELIQYSPTLSIRMSELGFDNKFLFGYRVTLGHDIYFAKHWLVGIRADFLQYHDRDLNSLLGIKAGYRF